VPRVLEGKGMDYWESGMYLGLGSDIFDSFRRYQSRLIREYNRLAQEFKFITVDARRPIETIQAQLRHRISAHLRARNHPTVRLGTPPVADTD
jgi:dTMP kinase